MLLKTYQDGCIFLLAQSLYYQMRNGMRHILNHIYLTCTNLEATLINENTKIIHKKSNQIFSSVFF